MFLDDYRQQVAEREALGVPPLPLSAEQTSDLCDLLKNPPEELKGELLILLRDRVPPGVDEAADVKAGFLTAINNARHIKIEFLSNIITGQISSSIISTDIAIELLVEMVPIEIPRAKAISVPILAIWAGLKPIKNNIALLKNLRSFIDRLTYLLGISLVDWLSCVLSEEMEGDLRETLHILNSERKSNVMILANILWTSVLMLRSTILILCQINNSDDESSLKIAD